MFGQVPVAASLYINKDAHNMELWASQSKAELKLQNLLQPLLWLAQLRSTLAELIINGDSVNIFQKSIRLFRVREFLFHF